VGVDCSGWSRRVVLDSREHHRGHADTMIGSTAAFREVTVLPHDGLLLLSRVGGNAVNFTTAGWCPGPNNWY
jgi:hypothetical protein